MRDLKQFLLVNLGWLGIRERLKASWLRDAYWKITGGERLRSRDQEVAFYRNLLSGFRPGDLIFDVGANIGQKTDVFLRLGARVLAVEPDEYNQGILREKFLKFRLTPKPVSIVGQAVSDKIATETMLVDQPGSALNTLSAKWVENIKSDKKRFEHTTDILEFAHVKTVQTITLEELIHQSGAPFFIKIDVEGFELNALRGLRCPVPYLSFEINLPAFRDEGLQCLTVLHDLYPAGNFNFAAGSEIGLALGEWTNVQQISQVLETTTEKNIEVFWRTNLGVALDLPLADGEQCIP